MATSLVQLEVMDKRQWTSAHLEGNKAKENPAKPTTKPVRHVEKHMQVNFGMRTNGPKKREKEKESLTKKGKEKERNENNQQENQRHTNR